MLQDASRILLIRFSSMGDILLTTPVIRAIKTKYPNIKIDAVVKSQFRHTLMHNPYLYKLHLFVKDGDSTKDLIKHLKRDKYDAVIDLQNNFRSSRVADAMKCDIYEFKKPTLKKLLLSKAKINLFKEIKPIPLRYAECLESENIILDDFGPEIYFPESIIPRIEEGENNIALCPGSAHFTKMWPVENFINIANRLAVSGYKIYLLGGSADKEICNRINKEAPMTINLAGKDDLLQLAADISQCRYAICNDSGMMHLATARGIPVFAIFGSTVREFGFFPYKSKSFVFEDKTVDCRPCSHTGKPKCPKKHFNCMNNLTPDKFLKSLSNFEDTL